MRVDRITATVEGLDSEAQLKERDDDTRVETPAGSETTLEAEQAQDERRREELRDPAYQARVIAPDVIEYPLQLEREIEVEREIEEDGVKKKVKVIETQAYVKTIELCLSFTPNQVNRQRVIDLLEQFAVTVASELSELSPESSLAGDWLTAHPGYFGAALSAPNVRTVQRKIIAAIAGVPVAEIEQGMESRFLTEFAILLLRRRNEEADRRKNAAGRA